MARLHFKLKEDAFLAIQLYTAENVDNNLGVCLFDEDTQQPVTTAFHRFVPMLYKQNEVFYLHIANYFLQ
jgi:hypothetical protein